MPRRDRFELFNRNVFINCPFDQEFEDQFRALIFAVLSCGYKVRCAKELDNGAEVRVEKIHRLIEECKLGIHDLSRTELNAVGLPRFNMPLELGIFLGARKFGSGRQRSKVALILDREQFRYQAFISDLAGHDIQAHAEDCNRIVGIVRDWLAQFDANLPGRQAIIDHYTAFQADLPALCAALLRLPQELTYNDLTNMIPVWLDEKPFVNA